MKIEKKLTNKNDLIENQGLIKNQDIKNNLIENYDNQALNERKVFDNDYAKNKKAEDLEDSPEVIIVKNLTKDYGRGRGIFDLNFSIKKGVTLGFVGANGAGKTTTIRAIMGFIKPDSGNARVKGLDSWGYADKIKQYVGYVPGEIGFPDLKTGTAFLKSQAELRGSNNGNNINKLLSALHLDPTANLKRMSKGMKQKTAIVTALSYDSEILILDEPTTGLDPLMRVAFLKLIEEEKKRGKTILISSHIYEELEQVCDYVVLIDKGRIVEITDMNLLRNRPVRDLKIEFLNQEDFIKASESDFEIIRTQSQYNQLTISINKNDLSRLFEFLSDKAVKFISEVQYNLERHFLNLIRTKQQIIAKQ